MENDITTSKMMEEAKELSEKIVSFFKDYDPYNFDDSYDSDPIAETTDQLLDYPGELVNAFKEIINDYFGRFSPFEVIEDYSNDDLMPIAYEIAKDIERFITKFDEFKYECASAAQMYGDLGDFTIKALTSNESTVRKTESHEGLYKIETFTPINSDLDGLFEIRSCTTIGYGQTIRHSWYCITINGKKTFRKFDETICIE